MQNDVVSEGNFFLQRNNFIRVAETIRSKNKYRLNSASCTIVIYYCLLQYKYYQNKFYYWQNLQTNSPSKVWDPSMDNNLFLQGIRNLVVYLEDFDEYI